MTIEMKTLDFIDKLVRKYRAKSLVLRIRVNPHNMYVDRCNIIPQPWNAKLITIQISTGCNNWHWIMCNVVRLYSQQFMSNDEHVLRHEYISLISCLGQHRLTQTFVVGIWYLNYYFPSRISSNWPRPMFWTKTQNIDLFSNIFHINK